MTKPDTCAVVSALTVSQREFPKRARDSITGSALAQSCTAWAQRAWNSIKKKLEWRIACDTDEIGTKRGLSWTYENVTMPAAIKFDLMMCLTAG